MQKKSPMFQCSTPTWACCWKPCNCCPVHVHVPAFYHALDGAVPICALTANQPLPPPPPSNPRAGQFLTLRHPRPCTQPPSQTRALVRRMRSIYFFSPSFSFLTVFAPSRTSLDQAGPYFTAQSLDVIDPVSHFGHKELHIDLSQLECSDTSAERWTELDGAGQS